MRHSFISHYCQSWLLWILCFTTWLIGFWSQYLQSWFCCSKTIRSLWICCLLHINYMLTHPQCCFSSFCFFKLYQLALRQGYSLHLSQFSSVKITDITNVDQFMACFFPEGLDTDQNTFSMKVHITVWLCVSCVSLFNMLCNNCFQDLLCCFMLQRKFTTLAQVIDILRHFY